MHHQSWKDTEPFPAFIPELIRFAESLGVLRMGTLKIDNENAAAQFWIIWRGKALIFKLAYVDKFRAIRQARCSPCTCSSTSFKKIAPTNSISDGVTTHTRSFGFRARRERWGIEAINPRTVRGLLWRRE